jgi:thymidine kinase
MAQLYYHYGTMNSGKSFELLKVAHNYEEQDKEVLVMVPQKSIRERNKAIQSRAGLNRHSQDTYVFNEDANLYTGIATVSSYVKLHCVLVDESQFLTRKQVEELASIVDDYGIPVMCFGLKNDFANNLFEGSEALLIYADKIKEIKTICWYCNSKANMVLRFDENGTPVYKGEQFKVGGNEIYKPCCRECYHTGGQRLEGED